MLALLHVTAYKDCAQAEVVKAAKKSTKVKALLLAQKNAQVKIESNNR